MSGNKVRQSGRGGIDARWVRRLQIIENEISDSGSREPGQDDIYIRDGDDVKVIGNILNSSNARWAIGFSEPIAHSFAVQNICEGETTKLSGIRREYFAGRNAGCHWFGN